MEQNQIWESRRQMLSVGRIDYTTGWEVWEWRFEILGSYPKEGVN